MSSIASKFLFSSVQSLSHVRLFATTWIAARQASLSITNPRSSLRLTSIESVMPSSHLILCGPFFSCTQYLPASESFPVSQLFAWGGQSTGVSALTSFLPKKSQTDSKWEDLSWKLNVFSFQQVNPAFTNILLPPLPKSLKRNYLNYHHLSLRNCYLEWISHSSQRVYISD